MREIHVNEIKEAVSKMCIEMNMAMSPDIKQALLSAVSQESSQLAQSVIGDLLKNADVAAEKNIPLCQDTGMVVVFVELGQNLTLLGGHIGDAIQEGVRQAYTKGYLRKSVVLDPLKRVNSHDNTPAVIHYDIVEGDHITLTIGAKGFGSENMSAMKMLKPSDGVDGVIAFVLETVMKAGPNPCPPIVVGVGIGGTMDKAATIAKKALMRDISIRHKQAHIADLETILLKRLNELGIGPQGFGGITTALGVNVEVYPTHIAGLPVAVNINCHASRHLTQTL